MNVKLSFSPVSQTTADLVVVVLDDEKTLHAIDDAAATGQARVVAVRLVLADVQGHDAGRGEDPGQEVRDLVEEERLPGSENGLGRHVLRVDHVHVDVDHDRPLPVPHAVEGQGRGGRHAEPPRGRRGKGEAEVAQGPALAGIEGTEPDERHVVGLQVGRRSHRRHHLRRPTAQREGERHPV